MSESEWRESRDTIAEFFRLIGSMIVSSSNLRSRTPHTRGVPPLDEKVAMLDQSGSLVVAMLRHCLSYHIHNHTATEPKGSAAVSTPPPSDLKKSCEEAAGASYPRGFGLIEEAAASGISVRDRILPVIRDGGIARKRGKTIDSWAFFEKPIWDSAVHTHAPPARAADVGQDRNAAIRRLERLVSGYARQTSAPQSRKGGWYFPSEFPPGVSFPASDVREERVKT